jgi:purine-binding chemotaxis protein CheW
VDQLLAFEIDGYQFGLHLRSVHRVVQAVEIQPVPDLPDTISGLINVHGTIIPVLNTRKRLGLPERPVALSDYFVIAATERQALALIVDSIQGVLNYSANQLISLDDVLPEKTPVNVLRIVDGILLVYNPEKSLEAGEWSTLGIALEQARGGHDQGN